MQTLFLLFSVPTVVPTPAVPGFHGAPGSWRFLSSVGGIFPRELLLLLLLRMQGDHAHEDVLLLGNTQEEAQAVSGKTHLRSWEVQEELEDEIKLSVGKQPCPVAVLSLQGSPHPLPI